MLYYFWYVISYLFGSQTDYVDSTLQKGGGVDLLEGLLVRESGFDVNTCGRIANTC